MGANWEKHVATHLQQLWREVKVQRKDWKACLPSESRVMSGKGPSMTVVGLSTDVICQPFQTSSLWLWGTFCILASLWFDLGKFRKRCQMNRIKKKRKKKQICPSLEWFVLTWLIHVISQYWCAVANHGNYHFKSGPSKWKSFKSFVGRRWGFDMPSFCLHFNQRQRATLWILRDPFKTVFLTTDVQTHRSEKITRKSSTAQLTDLCDTPQEMGEVAFSTKGFQQWRLWNRLIKLERDDRTKQQTKWKWEKKPKGRSIE